MRRALGVVVVTVALAAACESLWPRCQSADDCPSTHQCMNGRCTAGVADGGTGGSSTSSMAASSTSTATSSSSSSAGGSLSASSSSAASASATTASAAASGSSSGAVSASGGSTAGASSTSSGSGASSSGAYCAAYTNNAVGRALPLDSAGSTDVHFCRDGPYEFYVWKDEGVNLRAGSGVQMQVSETDRNDAGAPLNEVDYYVEDDISIQQPFGWLTGCNGRLSLDSCRNDRVERPMKDLYVVTVANGVQPMQFIQRARVTMATTGACATPPDNTSVATSVFMLFGSANGAVCTVADHYFHFLCGNAHFCQLRVTSLDGADQRTPMSVRLAGQRDGGGAVDCPLSDGGYTCGLLGTGVLYASVRPASGTPGNPLAESEYFHLETQAFDAGRPDSGPVDGGGGDGG